jgi:hypothetical protein
MEQLREGLEAKIQSMLETRRRAAFVENSLLSVFYFVAGIALTFFVWFVIDLFLWIFLFNHRNPFPPSATFVNGVATLLFVTISVWKREKIFEAEFASAHEYFGADNVANTFRTFDTIAGSVLICGPRFLVLALRAARLAKKIHATDLFLLIRPIGLAIQRRRKIREADLAGLRMAWFLDNSGWIDGVVPLLRKPAGFSVTDDFIREATGEEIPEPEYDYSRPRGGFEPESDAEPDSDSETIDDEVRWARMVLGVEPNATRAQVNAAYRKFAKLVHPDLHTNDPEARAQNEEHMKDLNLAYEILRRSA